MKTTHQAIHFIGAPFKKRDIALMPARPSLSAQKPTVIDLRAAYLTLGKTAAQEKRMFARANFGAGKDISRKAMQIGELMLTA